MPRHESHFSIVMHESGHMIAHCAQAVHFSGKRGAAGWNPRALMCFARPIAWRGQAEMQRPHPLQISSLTMTVARDFVLGTLLTSTVGVASLRPPLLPGKPHRLHYRQQRHIDRTHLARERRRDRQHHHGMR